MRVTVKAVLSHGEPDSMIEWKRLSENSKRLYTLPHAPGNITDDPQDAFQFGSIKDGEDNFGVINLTPKTLESLQLGRPNGPSFHVRAKWDISTQDFNYLAP